MPGLNEVTITYYTIVGIDARPGTQVVIMSNGGFGGVHQKLLDALAERAKEQG